MPTQGYILGLSALSLSVRNANIQDLYLSGRDKNDPTT
jgi:hypothetical protein